MALGGIAILVKNEMLRIFKVNTVLEVYDNVLGVKFSSRDGGTCVLVYCVYLPPESSRYGRNNEETLNRLMIDVVSSLRE